MENILSFIENHPLLNTLVSAVIGIIAKTIYDRKNNRSKFQHLKKDFLRDCEDYIASKEDQIKTIITKFREVLGTFQKSGFINSNLFSNAINDLRTVLEHDFKARWLTIERKKEDLDDFAEDTKLCDYFQETELTIINRAETAYQELLKIIDDNVNQARQATCKTAANLIK